MKRIQSTLLLLAILFVISSAGCRSGGLGQPYGQLASQPFVNQNTLAPQAGFGQAVGGQSGLQSFGQDLSRRFSNGVLNRAVGGVINVAGRAVGL